MRVALLTRRFDPWGGGTERDLVITAGLLRAAGHAVSIYAERSRAASKEFAVRQIGLRFAPRSIRLLAFARRAPAVARRGGADLVVSFARTIGADVLRSGGGAHASYLDAARQWRGGTASMMRLAPYHRAQMLIERRGFTAPSLKLALAVSRLVAADLTARFGLPSGKVVTLYNGVDLARFRPCADVSSRDNQRRELGLPVGLPLAFFIGNGFARKGLPELIDAWPSVAPDARLVVIGNDRRARAIHSHAARTGIAARAMFLGPRPDVPALLQVADVLVLPSHFEPFGNVVLEAMASGVPALTTVHAGAAEVLPPELSRFTVANPTDKAELAARLNALLAQSAALRDLARATAERFTWQRYGEELVSALGAL